MSVDENLAGEIGIEEALDQRDEGSNFPAPDAPTRAVTRPASAWKLTSFEKPGRTSDRRR